MSSTAYHSKLLFWTLIFLFWVFENAEAQRNEMQKVIWITHLRGGDVSQMDRIKILLLFETLKHNSPTDIEIADQEFKNFIKEFELHLNKSGLTPFEFMDVVNPFPSMNNNPYNKGLSLLILNEWKSQNANLFLSATQKYNNYLLNEDEFGKFTYDSDSIYTEVWSQYLNDKIMAGLMKRNINSSFWPDSNFNDFIYKALGFEKETVFYLNHFNSQGKPVVSIDSIRTLQEQHLNSYKENFNFLDNLRFDESRFQDWNDFVEHRKQQRKKEEKIVKDFRQGSKVIENLIGNFNEDDARKWGSVFNNMVNVYDAWSKWKHDYSIAGDDELKILISYATLGNGVISAGMGIQSILSRKNGITRDAAISSQLSILNEKIDMLSKQMHERFDNIDRNIANMFESMNSNFSSIQYDLQNISYVTEQTRFDLLRIKRQMNNIEMDIVTYLQDLSQLNLRENLTYFLDYKKNFNTNDIGETEFKRGVLEFADWGIAKPKSNLFSGSPESYVYDLHEIPQMIRKFSKGDLYDLNFFTQITARRFSKKYPDVNSKRSNQDIWNLGSEAFLDFALEWPMRYKEEITSNLLDQLIDNGNELLLNYKTILKDPHNNVDTTLFRQLIGSRKQAILNLQKKYHNHENNYIVSNSFDLDNDFSIWKIKKLDQYKIEFPAEMGFSSSIQHNLSDYDDNILDKIVNKATHKPLNLRLVYPVTFKVDTSSVLKYFYILKMGKVDLNYNYWEYLFSNYNHEGIDTDPGSLVFVRTSTRWISGFMIVEGKLGNEVIYRRANYTPGMYFRSEPGPGKDRVELAPTRAVSKSKGYIEYKYLRRSYSELFEDIWNSKATGTMRERFLNGFIVGYPDSVRGVKSYRPNTSIRNIKSDVLFELLRHQNKFYLSLNDKVADLALELNALDGSNDLIAAFFNLGMPNIAKIDSVKSYLLGGDRLMNSQAFLRILDEFRSINDQILKLNSDSTLPIDSLVQKMNKVYNESYYVKNNFLLNVRAEGSKVHVEWTESIFSNELKKLERFEHYTSQLFERINRNELTVNYPKVEPLLSKLNHLKYFFHN